ncbi:MAG: indolepyruvate ferredoxin oxidoreductase subunit alpha [Spirochaetaceae bacterium]|jgi:indolepyruvate ferredoxin oxidoreductase alpha subunit|nr:indolepyruvate ferredoxin oxidoreductase subunit alpha [Spirochaetaceae bacterium]
MKKILLMGNEAIALGAIRAGVAVVTGYPGTPSTEILETVAKHRALREGLYVEWSVNEKSALEVAAGAAYSGARAMVTMKQVGLNVAADPLLSLSYVGVEGGLVVVAADDPGPISSQTEQDTRRFGGFAKTPVFDPASPEEAYTMIADAFACSEKYRRPVILRPTTRICHSYASVELLDDLPRKPAGGFQKSAGRWVIFPSLAYRNHLKIEDDLIGLAGEFSAYPGNRLSGSGVKGVAAGGVSYAYLREVLEDYGQLPCKLLKIATVPFPDALGLEFLDGLEEVVVFEELDPVIEDSLVRLCGLHRLSVTIRGKASGDTPRAGENKIADMRRLLRRFLGGPEAPAVLPGPPEAPAAPELPVRPPVLCAGCPHRASFFAVKEAVKGRKAVFSGDIGCYTLGNAQPLDMVDTCLCMGAGITIAQGINRVEPDTLNFAFIGDSTFFHTGIPGIVNAVYNGADMIIVVLDNGTTAMTGNQPHPGIGKTATGGPAEKIRIPAVLKALGVADPVRVNPFDLRAAKDAVALAADKKGVRALIFEAPCIMLDRGEGRAEILEQKCTGCGVCVRKLGCPAISLQKAGGASPGGKPAPKTGGRALIDPALCTGCGICAGLCAFGAIREAI